MASRIPGALISIVKAPQPGVTLSSASLSEEHQRGETRPLDDLIG
jgi:hypothetical protein